MTTYTWPASITPTRTALTYRSGVSTFVSRSGIIQKAQQMPDHWALTISVDRRTSAERAAVQAFLLKLSAGDHNATIQDHSYVRRGSGSGTPLIKGAGQTGNSIITDGWTNSATGVLLEGDLIQIRNQLVMVTADVNANGSGEATISVVPAIRIAPSDNSAIVTGTPVGTWKLVAPEVGWGQGPGPIFSDFVIDLVEDVTA